MLEFPCFQVNENVTAQDPMVEHEIDAVVLIVKRDAFLPGFEAEAIAQLQKE